VVETDGDHRIGICFAIAALAGISGAAHIDDPACIDVSYRGFWDDLKALSHSVTAGAAR
jgi:5-enolpyruvylshikimate-3-phosphate synthase